MKLSCKDASFVGVMLWTLPILSLEVLAVTILLITLFLSVGYTIVRVISEGGQNSVIAILRLRDSYLIRAGLLRINSEERNW